MSANIKCPGCGLILRNQQIDLIQGYNASAECYEKYIALSGYTLNKQDLNFTHQHALDTYSAQHVGNGMKNITVAFSLIGLYYAVEHGFTGKQVQRVHMLLARQKYDWKELQAPQRPYSLTVLDVLKEKPGTNRDAMIRKWMINVWECWEHEHKWVNDITQMLLK